MSVPDYQSLILPVLKTLAGGTEIPVSAVRESVAAAQELTADDLRKLQPGD